MNDSDKTQGLNRSEALARRGESSLAKPRVRHTVGSLEEALLVDFPAADAESWDKTGLTVGERACPVTKVALALDPTVDAIKQAAAQGANVLITHHPPYLDAPDSFEPESSVALSPGAGVWAAIQHGVALLNYHTALDVSPRAARVLPGMLGLSFTGRHAEPIDAPDKGYGQISFVKEADRPMTVGSLAARCLSVFGRAPRVWGDLERELETVVTATGSLGPVGRKALAQGVSCVVCGEVKYHEALDLSGAGLAIIELGHDVSELPLVAVLADAVMRAGIAEEDVVLIDQSDNWTTPEAVRL